MNLPTFFDLAQKQSNPIPGQFLMSYWNGLSLSSPKLASNVKKFAKTETAGKRWSTDGLIGISFSINWWFFFRYNKIQIWFGLFCCISPSYLYIKLSKKNSLKRMPFKVKNVVNLLSGSIKMPQPQTFPWASDFGLASTGHSEYCQLPKLLFIEIFPMVYLFAGRPRSVMPKLIPSVRLRRPTKHLVNFPF
jgi:hypothetical protein